MPKKSVFRVPHLEQMLDEIAKQHFYNFREGNPDETGVITIELFKIPDGNLGRIPKGFIERIPVKFLGRISVRRFSFRAFSVKILKIRAAIH